MKVYNCECGDIIGCNSIKRHKQGKKHYEKMIKMKLQYFPTDEDELKDKWCDIIERRNYYWKQEEEENNKIERINRFKELSNDYCLLIKTLSEYDVKYYSYLWSNLLTKMNNYINPKMKDEICIKFKINNLTNIANQYKYRLMIKNN